EKQTISSKSRRILVICSSRTSDSLLLKYTLKKWFHELILEIDVLNFYQMDENKIKQYDVVFTTIEEGMRLVPNAIKINYFLDQKDYLSIQKVLLYNGKETQSLHYFEEALFLHHVLADSKEEVLKKMSALALKYKKVESNLYESVIQRETYGFTSYGNLVAIPHPNDLISEETFVVTAILEKPIPWGTQDVQLVFLICTEKESRSDLKYLFGVVSRLLSNVEAIQEIISKKNFDHMMECLRKEL
ncbi:MAG: PTS sugar transporter subunit IIA, partial [Longicatena sp.]